MCAEGALVKSNPYNLQERFLRIGARSTAETAG
jgi:hypothetical protein